MKRSRADLRFVEIGKNGQPATFVGKLSETAKEICQKTAKLCQTVESFAPWIGYLVVENSIVVGTCAFRSPPRNDEVEIAYFTFPEFEGRGLATEMVRYLAEVARSAEPDIKIFAFTLPEKNASNRILQKLGFHFAGETQDEDGRDAWRWQLPASHCQVS